MLTLLLCLHIVLRVEYIEGNEMTTMLVLLFICADEMSPEY